MFWCAEPKPTPQQVATLPKREDLQEVDKVSVFLIKAMSRRQSLTSPFPLTLPFRDGRNLLWGGFRRPPRHIKISRHGLEIRGSEVPTVQGTEEVTTPPSYLSERRFDGGLFSSLGFPIRGSCFAYGLHGFSN